MPKTFSHSFKNPTVSSPLTRRLEDWTLTPVGRDFSASFNLDRMTERSLLILINGEQLLSGPLSSLQQEDGNYAFTTRSSTNTPFDLDVFLVSPGST